MPNWGIIPKNNEWKARVRKSFARKRTRKGKGYKITRGINKINAGPYDRPLKIKQFLAPRRNRLAQAIDGSYETRETIYRCCWPENQRSTDTHPWHIVNQRAISISCGCARCIMRRSIESTRGEKAQAPYATRYITGNSS